MERYILYDKITGRTIGSGLFDRERDQNRPDDNSTALAIIERQLRNPQVGALFITGAAMDSFNPDRQMVDPVTKEIRDKTETEMSGVAMLTPAERLERNLPTPPKRVVLALARTMRESGTILSQDVTDWLDNAETVLGNLA